MTKLTLELNMASNLGGKLSPDVRRRLIALHSNPTEATWDDAHCIILDKDSWLTLWQAIIAVDPTFPRTGKVTDECGHVIEGWSRIPSRDLVARAIRYATH